MSELLHEAIELGGKLICAEHSRVFSTKSPTSGRWGHKHKQDGQAYWCVARYVPRTEGGVK